MYLKIKVHPSSNRDEVKQKASDSFEVSVREKPIDGKATEAALIAVSEFLRVPRSRIRLIRGSSSHNKIVELVE